MSATLTLPALPSDRDRSASLTAVGMGEMIAAMDALVSCYESEYREDGRKIIEAVHERRSDGSCRCGYYVPRQHVRRTV